MSEDDPDAVTVSADGITLRKTVETEQFQTVAVVVELTSERDDRVRVQVLDPTPSAVQTNDIEFRPDYGGEHWSVEDNEVAFERDLESDEAYTTLYGIRDYPESEVDALLEEPSMELVDTTPGSLDEVIDEGRSDAVRDFVSGEADLPGLEQGIASETPEPGQSGGEPVTENEPESETPEPDDEAEPIVTETDEAEPIVTEADEAEPMATETDEAEPIVTETDEAEPIATEADEAEPIVTEADESDAAVAPVGEDRDDRGPLTGGVVRVLIKELRERDVDPDDRRLLSDELLEAEGAIQARVGHLQQRVSDLEAYTDALEAFIEEDGNAEQVIADLRGDVEGLERELRSTDDRVDDAVERLSAVDERVDTVQNNVEEVQTRAEHLSERLEDVEVEITGVEDRADDLDARLGGVSADVDRVDDRMAEVDGRVEEARDELDTLQRNLRMEVQALEEDLDDFEEFRERLSLVFDAASNPSEAGGHGSD